MTKKRLVKEGSCMNDEYIPAEKEREAINEMLRLGDEILKLKDEIYKLKKDRELLFSRLKEEVDMVINHGNDREIVIRNAIFKRFDSVFSEGVTK